MFDLFAKQGRHLIIIIMHHQICPWRFESQSLIFDNDCMTVEPTLSSNVSPQPQRRTLKRPKTCNPSQERKLQKKIARPLSCQKSLQMHKKQIPNQSSSTKAKLVSSKQIPRCSSSISKISDRANFQKSTSSRITKNASAIYTGYAGFTKCRIKRDERPSSIFSKQMMEKYNKSANKMGSQHTTPKTNSTVLDMKMASMLKVTSLTKNPIRLSMMQKQQEQSSNPVIKKIGFVYYNQSFFQGNQMRYA